MGRQTKDNAVSPRTERSYEAKCADKSAPHDEVHGSAHGVNDRVVQLQFALLSGETCMTSVPIHREALAAATLPVIMQESAEGIVPSRPRREGPNRKGVPQRLLMAVPRRVRLSDKQVQA